MKNHNVFGKDCNIYFPRFFHNAPGGPLVNHFYKDGTVFAAPLKAIEVDREGKSTVKASYASSGGRTTTNSRPSRWKPGWSLLERRTPLRSGCWTRNWT
ncbi:MAG: hypothetical protein ACYTDW_21760 [Planctomycetota bacterium]